MKLSLSLPALMLVLAAPGSGAQVTIHERIIVRVPRMPTLAAPLPMKWREKRGPHCIIAGDLAGEIVTQPDAVDLVMAGGQRLRAKLNGDCQPLDFYSGFYLKPAADGKICAGRDAVRARSGATCPIARFRSLQPDRSKH